MHGWYNTEMSDRRIALVTGAGSGIGQAIALRLVADGCRVAAADLNLAGAEATAAQASEVSAFEVDVADQGSVEALVAEVVSAMGSPTVLVNCAGWDEFHPFLETDRPFWDRIVAVNYLGVVSVCHVVAPLMIEAGGGRVVNIASDAGRVGSTGEAVYAGAKGGVIAFSKSLAREVARHAITVNAVCPGPADTPLFQGFPERIRQSLQRAIPLGRLAEPDDVAHAVSYFASPGAGFVTGQVLSVSGGLTMHG
jgi:2-hydroxycyclohexanecarboxyl-CoA dehydrogenase